MRILLDTNVLITVFIARGTCSELLQHCARAYTVVSSQLLLREFEEKLTKKFHYTRQDAREVLALLRYKYGHCHSCHIGCPRVSRSRR